MFTGKHLGDALAAAIKLKGVSKADVARHFNVKPPSVQGWIKYGRISKAHLPRLFAYFSDVVGLEHWGLTEPNFLISEAKREKEISGDKTSKSLLIPSREKILLGLFASMSKDEQDELIYAIQQKQYYDKRVKKLLAVRKNQDEQQGKARQETELDSESWEIEGVVGDLSDLRRRQVKRSKKAG